MNTRKISIVLTFGVLLASSVVIAQVESKAELIDRLLVVKNHEAAEQRVLQKISSSMSQHMLVGAMEKGLRPTQDVDAFFKEEVKVVLTKELIDSDLLTSEVKRIYDEEFTASELSELIYIAQTLCLGSSVLLHALVRA